jgi:RNA binding exosome subunit
LIKIAQLLVEMSHFEQILNKLLAEMSHFEQILNKMRQRATSNGAIYLRQCRILIKIAQLLAEMSHFDKDCAITCGNVAF